jgi:hypothetical protein
MYSKIVIFSLIWLLIAPFIYSAEQDGISQSNKFLSAEVKREIDSAKDEMLTELKNYQDENFVVLDTRMISLMDDVRIKVTLGAIGAALVAQALTAIVLVRAMRNYSYETYLEKLLKNTVAQNPQLPGDEFVQMQQKEWHPQQPINTIGMELGPERSAQATMMNQWQSQPAYAGSWRAPVDVQPNYQHIPADYAQNPEYSETQQGFRGGM